MTDAQKQVHKKTEASCPHGGEPEPQRHAPAHRGSHQDLGAMELRSESLHLKFQAQWTSPAPSLPRASPALPGLDPKKSVIRLFGFYAPKFQLSFRTHANYNMLLTLTDYLVPQAGFPGRLSCSRLRHAVAMPSPAYSSTSPLCSAPWVLRTEESGGWTGSPHMSCSCLNSRHLRVGPPTAKGLYRCKQVEALDVRSSWVVQVDPHPGRQRRGRAASKSGKADSHKAAGGRTRTCPPSFRSEHSPANTLILDCWPPQLCESALLWF